MISNKNILITGGAGFIGSHLFETLIKHNNYITIIDNFDGYYSGKEENFNYITNKFKNKVDFKLIRGDLLDNSTYNKIKTDYEIIFHLAAQPGVRYSIEHAPEITHNNITSTVNIFEYAKENDINKVVIASSSSVYGNPNYTPVDEKHPKNPISPYAVSKLCCEEYAHYYFREYGLPVTSLRFYTVFGPRGRPDMAIRKFFNLILQEKPINVYGDGKQLRDFTYVSNIVNGLILAAEKDESSGKSFNLGCSDPISVNELIDKMYNIAGKSKKVNYTEKRKGDVKVTHSDITKAKNLLGYTPKIDIDKGLKKTYKWQKTYQTK